MSGPKPNDGTPVTQDEVRRGVVESFDPEVGLGQVSIPGGAAFRFHCTTIADGSRHIEAGQAVSFVVRPAGPGQWEAMAITPIAPIAP